MKRYPFEFTVLINAIIILFGLPEILVVIKIIQFCIPAQVINELSCPFWLIILE